LVPADFQYIEITYGLQRAAAITPEDFFVQAEGLKALLSSRH
jgi:hypothetical protein